MCVDVEGLAVFAHLSESNRCSTQDDRTWARREPLPPAAGSADSGEILTGTAGSVLASIAAALAALGLILEATLS